MILSIDFSDLLETETTDTGCQGNIYKASVSVYKTKRGFAQTIRLNRSARLSCPGCSYCGWQYESIDEIGHDWPVLGIEDAEDGKFYGLSICNHSSNWESGLVDDWDLEMIPFIPTKLEDE
jgi:hypothetical protein